MQPKTIPFGSQPIAKPKTIAFSSSFPTEDPNKQSFMQKLGSVLGGVGNALTSSEQGVGRSLSSGLIPKLPSVQQAQTSIDQAQAYGPKLLQAIRDAKSQGKDTTNLERVFKETTGQDISSFYKDVNPASEKTTKQALGEVAGVGLDVLTAGSYGKAGAETGKLLKTGAKTIEEIANAEKASNLGKNILKGAGLGYGYDVAGNLQANKEEVLKPGLGTVIGASTPLVAEAIKGIGFIAKQVAKYTASGLSGVPVSAIEEGFKNPEKVQNAIRKATLEGDEAAQKILNNAQEAIDNIENARRQAYQQGLAKLEKEATYTKGGKLYVQRVLTDTEAKATKGYVPGTKVGVPTNLTTSGIKNVFTTTLKDFGAEGGGKGGLDFTNVALDDTHISKLQKLQERIYNWTDKTPTGLNRLNQVIDSYRLGGINLGSSENKFNAIITGLKNNLTSYLGERVPQVAEMNAKYSAQSKVIDNINNQLKLNAKDPNTALRKLLNVFNPKSVVYKPVVDQLGEKGAKDLMSDIAGLTMSKWTPEGLAKYFDLSGATVATILQPQALLATPLASPRIVGETTTTLGKIAKNKKAKVVAETIAKGSELGSKLLTRQTGLSK